MSLSDFLQKLPYKPYDYQMDYLKGIDKARSSGRNYLVTMPTGTGKTMAYEFVANLGKTIYTVPIRALADEKLEETPEKFPHLRVLRDTGADLEDRDTFDYENQDVIITTNERLLSIMNTSVSKKVMKNVQFIVFDEIHTINDIGRGATIEWVIMLLKRFYPHITIVGLSATLPNYQEFAEWLGADYTWLPESKRPIPLEFHFGTPVDDTYGRMSKLRDLKFSQLVSFTYKFKEQFLVFMSSKRSIEEFAKKYAAKENGTLEDIMKKGVAFHHADLNEDQKKLVLDEFKAGNIRIIFCSPTLAVGVNLPATNCVIFDMSFWNDISWTHEPLPADKLSQMFGRAGRVGYSDVGRVIILGTEEEINIAKYHIESPHDTVSQFGRVLVDKILNMIVSKIAVNVQSMYDIIKESFLYHQNQSFDKSIIEDSIDILYKNGLINTDDGVNFRSTMKGTLVTKMYVKVHSVIDAKEKIKDTFKFTNVFDLYRVFLGHEEFLGNISVGDSSKDSAVISKTRNFFKDSKMVNQYCFIRVYDKDQNTHVHKEKSSELLKALGIIFKNDVLGKKAKMYTSEATVWKLRKEGSGLVARLGMILEADLVSKGMSKDLLTYAETAMKYGTLNKKTIELFSIKGLGTKTADKLIAAGIDSKEKLAKTSVTKLKSLGVRNANSILKKVLADEYKQTTINEWFT